MEKTIKKSTGSKEPHSRLEDYFMDALQDIYWAEKHLVKSLPKMSKAATSEALKNAFNDHLAATEGQVTRLEEVFKMMDKKPTAKKCEAMAGIVKEGETIIDETEEGTMTRDVGLIMAAQKVEHYEISTYGGLVQLAKTLGRTDVANRLHETLDEEKEADEMLTTIAESNVNEEAYHEVG
jgi:ferritin-like metal-binding protein YciE